MKKAPAWLVERIGSVSASGPSLWVGAPLAFPEPLRVRVLTEGEPSGGPYQAVFVARAEGELDAVLGALRPVCAPGARLLLLLPEPGGGVGGGLRAWLGPLGRRGRAARPLTEQCGAMLAAGAVDVEVVALAGRQRCVQARLPVSSSLLDREFVTAPA